VRMEAWRSASKLPAGRAKGDLNAPFVGRSHSLNRSETKPELEFKLFAMSSFRYAQPQPRLPIGDGSGSIA
jgi:hypothetical protein